MRSGAVGAALVALAVAGADGLAAERRSLDGVLVQLDWEPTWGALEDLQNFGRIPELTLFEDGTVIYLEHPEPGAIGSNVRAVRLGPEERSALVEEVVERGFARLESHTSERGPGPDGSEVVVFDSAYSDISVRLPNGELRTIRNYADFANDQEALESIRQLLSEWSSPDAEPYVPARATVIIKWLDPRSAASFHHHPEIAWPLQETLLQQPEEGVCEWAVPIGSSEYRSLISQPGLGPQWTYFSTLHEGKRLFLSLVPWLPNEDHAAAVRRYRQRCLWRPGPYAGSVRWIHDTRY